MREERFQEQAHDHLCQMLLRLGLYDTGRELTAGFSTMGFTLTKADIIEWAGPRGKDTIVIS